jgi:hypothetical protein
MKRWTGLLTAVVAGGLILTPLQSAKADEPGWGLALKSPHLGMLYLYVTTQGFALVYPKTGAKFVMHAPNWKVVMYNDKTKTYYVESMEDLKQYGKSKTAQELKTHAKLNSTRKGQTLPIAQAKATQYFINASSNSGPKQVEAWITNDIHPPDQLGLLLGKLFDVDTSNFPKGLPLKVKIADDSGKKDTLYETLKIEPQVIKSASFTYPATYKHVNSELEVAVDEPSRKKMESILEDSDELTALLGSSSGKSSYGSRSTYGSSYASRPASNAYNNRPAYSSTPAYAGSYSRPAQAARPAVQQKPANNDWWGNIMNTFNGPKK